MWDHHNLLIVIADGEHFRLVRPAKDNALHSVSAADSMTAHKRSAELGSDHPGASFHSDSSAHHRISPRHDLHRLEEERFGQLLAEQLVHASLSDAFGALVIAAPAHILHAVRQALPPEVGAKIVGMLAKDLVKVPDDALQPHLAQWVRPVHRVTG